MKPKYLAVCVAVVFALVVLVLLCLPEGFLAILLWPVYMTFLFNRPGADAGPSARELWLSLFVNAAILSVAFWICVWIVVKKKPERRSKDSE